MPFIEGVSDCGWSRKLFRFINNLILGDSIYKDQTIRDQGCYVCRKWAEKLDKSAPSSNSLEFTFSKWLGEKSASYTYNQLKTQLTEKGSKGIAGDAKL